MTDGPDDVLWWVTVTNADGVQVYDGPAPCPAELCTISVADAEAGRLFEFDMKPMGPTITRERDDS